MLKETHQQRENPNQRKVSSSFRDRLGFIFELNGQIFRQINKKGIQNYRLLQKTGLYKVLTDSGFLVRHSYSKKLSLEFDEIILKPQRLPLITYPYEWTLGQLKEAALLTLKIQKLALEYGISLKDASAYNIQFLEGKPIFIDITSFEKYKEGHPWVSYRQFCEHFISPLSLLAKKDLRLGTLQSKFLDGIPLDLTVSLLPFRSFLNKEILFHVYFHFLFMKNKANKQPRPKSPWFSRNSSNSLFTALLQPRVKSAWFSQSLNKVLTQKPMGLSKNSLILIIDSLEKLVKSFEPPKNISFWKKYYDFSNYSVEAFSFKKKEVEKMVKKIHPKVLLDIGANTGVFSKIASKHSGLVVSTDYDPVVIEENFNSLDGLQKRNILPLVIDVTNPSSGIGWKNMERTPFFERIDADCVMALAILHHLVISNNLNFKLIADFFKKTTKKYLIIEYVDTLDSQIKDLFEQRGVREDYNIDNFEKHFSKGFKLLKKVRLKNTYRYLYLYLNK